MRIALPAWLKKDRGSLDELLSSLPVLEHPEDPNSKALILVVGWEDKVLRAQYVHEGKYKERAVGFSYIVDRKEHRFSISERHSRILLEL